MIERTKIKQEARQTLKGKWKKAVGITFLYSLISVILSILVGYTKTNMLNQGTIFNGLTVMNITLTIVQLIIAIPLSYGIVAVFMKLRKGKDVKPFEFVSVGFENFSRAWSVLLHTLAKLIAPLSALVISLIVTSYGYMAMEYYNYNSIDSIGIWYFGILLEIASYISLYIVSLKYSIVYNIAYDEPKLSAEEVVEKSKKLMNGKCGEYFGLILSFVGWMILAGCTLGIGLFWLIPYISISTICFYEAIKGKKKRKKKTTETTKEK